MNPLSSKTLCALVVDDSMLIRHTVCRFMEEKGFTVRSAQNGEDALREISQMRPDIVITDIQMPRMSGAELITHLKSQPRTANIPVVIVASQQDGMSDYGRDATYVVFKDIDIVDQLSKALAAIFGKEDAKSQFAGL